jgi:hypothetical protein
MISDDAGQVFGDLGAGLRPGHLLRQPARRISLDDLGMLFRQDLSDRAADFLRQPAIGSFDREVTPLIVAEKCLAPLAPEGRPLTFRRDGSLQTHRWRRESRANPSLFSPIPC